MSKITLMASVAVALLFCGTAAAQDQNQNDQKHAAHFDKRQLGAYGQAYQQNHDQQNRTPSRQAAHSHRQQLGAYGQAEQRAYNRNPDGEHGWQGSAFRHENRGEPGTYGPNYRRNDGEWRRYEHDYESPRRFNIGTYEEPRGYAYHRWVYGEVLPRSYFGSDYWISNWAYYGLMPPPAGTVWVRYGPDALLIDEATGEIIQVDYNVFY